VSACRLGALNEIEQGRSSKPDFNFVLRQQVYSLKHNLWERVATMMSRSLEEEKAEETLTILTNISRVQY
jgi:hypothetical protein